jgi:hypothetical protein
MSDRTPEQHMADVANTALERLGTLNFDLRCLTRHLGMLSEWAADHSDPHAAALLGYSARFAIVTLTCNVPEAVRDIAMTLPVRGTEYE